MVSPKQVVLAPTPNDIQALLNASPEAQYQLKIIVLERMLRDAQAAEALLRKRLEKYEPPLVEAVAKE